MFGITASKTWIRNFLKKMGWSLKVPVRFQLLKYTRLNIFRYVTYLRRIQSIPAANIKFLDEAHFVSHKLNKSRVWGVRGVRTYTRVSGIHEPAASITLLTSLQDPTRPVYFDYRLASNDQWDFAKFVFNAVIFKQLVSGDFLVIDNAAVHGGLASWPTIQRFFRLVNVRLLFLPAYSPELNPCELVFAQLKKQIRRTRAMHLSLFCEVIKAIGDVTHEDVKGWYKHCIHPRVVLPELRQ